MENEVGHETVGDVTITYYVDPEPEDPREYDNASVMCHWHRGYDLGDRKVTDGELTALQHGGIDGLRRHLERQHGPILALEPLALLDHSGLHMWVGDGAHWSDAQGWDSGAVGFAYVTEKRGVEILASTTSADAEKAIKQEVSTYDDYLSGNCYGYVISTPDDEHAESCWGFLGDLDYCKTEAQAEAKAIKTTWDEENEADPWNDGLDLDVTPGAYQAGLGVVTA